MSDDARVYSDEEFALILRKATELAGRVEPTAASSDGLTLAEIKAAAAQAGFDPVLVERAARLIAVSAPMSLPAQVIGGELRHDRTMHLPVALSENAAAKLLSSVRIVAGLAGARDVGHSDAMGMTWHDGGATESLRVTARPEDGGTIVTVEVDRRGTFALVVMFSAMSLFLATLFAVFGLYPESPALGIAGLIAGWGGTVAVARSYWAATTRRVRDRIGGVLDAVGKTLSRPDREPSDGRAISHGDSPEP